MIDIGGFQSAQRILPRLGIIPVEAIDAIHDIRTIGPRQPQPLRIRDPVRNVRHRPALFDSGAQPLHFPLELLRVHPLLLLELEHDSFAAPCRFLGCFPFERTLRRCFRSLALYELFPEFFGSLLYTGSFRASHSAWRGSTRFNGELAAFNNHLAGFVGTFRGELANEPERRRGLLLRSLYLVSFRRPALRRLFRRCERPRTLIRGVFTRLRSLLLVQIKQVWPLGLQVLLFLCLPRRLERLLLGGCTSLLLARTRAARGTVFLDGRVLLAVVPRQVDIHRRIRIRV